MSSPLRVGIYLRVSTADQQTDLQSREIMAYVHARGWTNHVVYEDKATGTHSGRPAFQSMLKDVKSRRIDVVICWKLDRFSRSLRDLVITLQEFSESGTAFVSIRDQVDLTTSSGRLMLHLIGAFAEFEASLIRERVRAGLSAAKARGQRLGRPKMRNDRCIRNLRDQGLSYTEIGKKLGISKGAVCRALATSKTPLKA